MRYAPFSDTYDAISDRDHITFLPYLKAIRKNQ